MSKKKESIRFTGELDQLKAYIMCLCDDGVWSGVRNHFQCRFPNGAVLNWWKSTGTLQVQGPDGPAAALEEQLYRLVQEAGEDPYALAIGLRRKGRPGADSSPLRLSDVPSVIHTKRKMRDSTD